MPYVTQARGSGSHRSQGRMVSPNPARSVSIDRDWVTKLEAVYSYRSSSPPNALKAERPPRTLGLKMAQHLREIESAVEDNLDGRNGAVTHFLTKDLGHNFAKAETTCTVGNGTISGMSGLGEPMHFQGFAPPARWILDETPMGVVTTMGGVPDYLGMFTPLNMGSQLGLNSATFMSSDMFNSVTGWLIAVMNPMRARADVLATVLELVTGNVPKILQTLAGHLGTLTRLKRQYTSWLEVDQLLRAGKWVGGSSLNIQFGWAPIIRDVGNALQLMYDIDALVFTPDTRRERRIPVRSWSGQLTQSEDWYGRHPLWPVMADDGAPKHAYNLRAPAADLGLSSTGFAMKTDWTFQASVDMQVDARYSGNLIPPVKGNEWIDHALSLAGARLTPAVIWELTPWSWLLDWFFNLGTIVENASTLQLSGVILNYAYATSRLNLSSTARAVGPAKTTSAYTGHTNGCVAHFVHVGKVRKAASPFGFGTSIGSLTATQWNILASLGLARRR